MRPLQCPDGFRAATGSDHALMVAFLDAEVAAAKPCGKAGIVSASKSYQVTSGCVSKPPSAGWAMAEGVLSFVCNGNDHAQEIGVEADGEYA